MHLSSLALLLLLLLLHPLLPPASARCGDNSIAHACHHVPTACGNLVDSDDQVDARVSDSGELARSQTITMDNAARAF